VSEDEARAQIHHVACAQFDVRRGRVAENVEEAERIVRIAAGHGARLVVLPEMWTTSVCRSEEYTPQVLEASRAAEARMQQLGRELALVIVGGGPVREGGEIFNRALVTDSGDLLAEYRKIHLFSPMGEDKSFAPGGDPVVVDTSVGRIGVAICYDVRFPELTRWYFHRGCEILAVPAQWPEARAAHWRLLLRARALENEMFVLGCNRIGIEVDPAKPETSLVFPGQSRIVDPMGEVIASAEGEGRPLEADIELRKVRMMRRILPIGRDRRPQLYRGWWQEAWEAQQAAEEALRDGSA
jgi:omega-amidase